MMQDCRKHREDEEDEEEEEEQTLWKESRLNRENTFW